MARLRTLRSRYDKASERLREAQERTAELKAQVEDIKAQHQEARTAESEALAEHKRLQDELDAVLEQADQSGVPSPSAVAAAAPPPRPAHQVPVTLPPSIQQVVFAIPLNGEISKPDLCQKLGMKESVVHTRVQKGKKLDLIESAGWGKYKLTDAGRKLRGTTLKAVPSAN